MRLQFIQWLKLLLRSAEFNKFYHDNSILVEDAELRKARLALVCATRQALENGLKLLGMQAPERM